MENKHVELLTKAQDAIDEFTKRIDEILKESEGRIEFQIRVPIESGYYFPHVPFTDFESKQEKYAYKVQEMKIHLIDCSPSQV